MRAFLMVVAVAFHGVCASQTGSTSPYGAFAATSAPSHELDLRLGSFRPMASVPEAMEGSRSVPHSFALPRTALGKEYCVGPNDLLEVEVFEMENLKRTVRVNAAGSISLPLIGTVAVAGLTSEELEARIAERYREKYLQNPQVSVFIKEFTTERITVEGAVVRPGIYPLSGKITLLRALALAGGFGMIANSSEVMLFRVNESGGREVAVFDVERIRAGKQDDPTIKGDDLVVVQRDASRKMFKDSLFRDVIDSINPFSVFAR